MPVYNFGEADVVVSFDADFMNDYPGRLRYAREFADRRRVHQASADPGRFYAIDTTPTHTSPIADHRVPLAPGELLDIIAAAARSLSDGTPERTSAAGVTD